MSVLARASWPLRTDRLVIRPAEPRDADEMFRIHFLPGVSDFLNSLVEDPEVWRERFADPERISRRLVVSLAEEPDRLIGDLMVLVSSPWSQVEVRDAARDTEAELGWVLDPAYGGLGLATEAVRAVLGVCFGPLGLRRVTAGCVAPNTASWRLMERVGMRREAHTVRAELLRDGTWVDAFSYAILREEW